MNPKRALLGRKLNFENACRKEGNIGAKSEFKGWRKPESF